MMPPFFPNPYFGWAFFALLAAFLVAASNADLRAAVIPKQVTLTAAVAGLLLNLVRCAWLGSAGHDAWLFKQPGPALGALDGALFSIAGWVFGFAFFTLLWILGIAGGGDVKFFAAIGAWVGPKWALYVIIVSVLINAAIVMYQAFRAVVTGNRKALRSPAPDSRRAPVRLVTFGLPLSIATVIVLAWKVQHELNLKPAAPIGAAVEEGRHHAIDA